MGVRFFRRVTLAPGLRLNLSRSGPSLSFGARGAHVTVGPRGVRKTVGIPGTGLFYTSTSNRHTGVHTAKQFDTATSAQSLRRKLADLHRAGLLTDAEYQDKVQALEHRSG